MYCRTILQPLAAAAFLALLACPARAQFIIKEAFQENPGTQDYQTIGLIGVKPAPVDLPGVAWQLASGDGDYEASISGANATSSSDPSFKPASAGFHNVASAALAIASRGPYLKPSILTVSARLSFRGDADFADCYLGFYSTLPGKGNLDPSVNFTGLQLEQNGFLQLVQNGVPVAASGASYKGTYDPNKPVTLTYTIDISRGVIYNVSLEGSAAAYSFPTTAFTNAATAFLGIGGDGGSATVFSNLQLYGAGPPAR